MKITTKPKLAAELKALRSLLRAWGKGQPKATQAVVETLTGNLRAIERDPHNDRLIFDTAVRVGRLTVKHAPETTIGLALSLPSAIRALCRS